MTENYDDAPQWKDNTVEILLLLCGLLFLIGGACASSDLLDFGANLLDVRQWNGFMITAAILNAVFIVYWIVVWRFSADESFDEDEFGCVRSFIPSTVVVCAQLCVGFYLSTTEFPRFAGYQIRQTLCNGVYSSAGTAIALGIAAALIVNAVIIVRDLRKFLNYWA